MRLQASGVDQLTCFRVPSNRQEARAGETRSVKASLLGRFSVELKVVVFTQTASDSGSAERTAAPAADGGSVSWRGTDSNSRHVHPGEEERSSPRWFSSTAAAVLDPPLEEKALDPTSAHPKTLAKTVASTVVPEKPPSTGPDSQEPPESTQEGQVPRTVSSR